VQADGAVSVTAPTVPVRGRGETRSAWACVLRGDGGIAPAAAGLDEAVLRRPSSATEKTMTAMPAI
jgi:hypothetical protein